MLSIALDASAQRGGPRLTPEEYKAIWSLEAKVVAQGLKLDEANAAKLDEAYNAAKTSYNDAIRAAFEGGGAGGGQGGMSAFRELRTKEADKLKAAVAAFLSEAQVAEVMKQLGGFDRSLDTMVNTLIGFALDEEKTTKGVQMALAYAATVQAAMAGDDREAARTAQTDAKTKLDEDIAALLSADQLAKWKEETAPRSFGGGQRGGGQGGGGQRGGNQ